MSVEIEIQTPFDPRFPLSRMELRELMERLLEFLELGGADVDLRIVGDGEMARLNRDFLGMAGPTNVLSFPASDLDEVEWGGDWETDPLAEDCGCEDDPDAELDGGLGCGLDCKLAHERLTERAGEDGADNAPFLGSIALSADTLAREADLYGQPPREHLVRLLTHALLHLAGMDHGEEMYGLTDRAVETLSGASL